MDQHAALTILRFNGVEAWADIDPSKVCISHEISGFDRKARTEIVVLPVDKGPIKAFLGL